MRLPGETATRLSAPVYGTRSGGGKCVEAISFGDFGDSATFYKH